MVLIAYIELSSLVGPTCRPLIESLIVGYPRVLDYAVGLQTYKITVHVKYG